MENTALIQKWDKILNHPKFPKITDQRKLQHTAFLLEQYNAEAQAQQGREQFLTEETTASGNGIQNFQPVLISLVRRAMPNLIAYDLGGVQTMKGPTDLIFAMKSRYQSTVGTVTSGDEALHAKPDTAFSGNSSGKGMTLAEGEVLGRGQSGDGSFSEMGFTIEKATVTARTRALKAEFTMELQQDLKKVHGLEAENELGAILATEILAEINREFIDTINAKAIHGADNVGSDGVFDLNVDADGRWAVEKFKSLMFQMEIEANAIAKGTRRGRGNWVICSSNVASALAAAGVLDYTPAIQANLNVDDTGNTFAGVINGRTKVYVDPYAVTDYATMGYKGPNPYDCGIFYAPYIPLTMVRATGENDFQPKIGFKTRYGMVANPFALAYTNGVATTELGADNANPYFRTITVSNINVGS